MSEVSQQVTPSPDEALAWIKTEVDKLHTSGNQNMRDNTTSGSGSWRPPSVPYPTCPHCGYCPYCGRGGYQTYLVYPYYGIPFCNPNTAFTVTC